MKHITLLIITAVMLLAAQTANAQKNIVKAYEAITGENSTVKLLGGDANQTPDRGKMCIYQCYEFEADKKNTQWLQLKKAFDTDVKDAYNAYSKNEGSTNTNEERIAFGTEPETDKNIITFGTYRNHNYRVYLFRDPTDRLWRTCYALVWYDSYSDSDKLHGYVYKIYCRDPKLVGKERQQTTISMLNDGSMIQYDNATGVSTVVQTGSGNGERGSIKTSVDFLSRFNNLRSMYMDKLESSSPSLSFLTSVVNNVLMLCKQHASVLDAEEKTAVRNILVSMQQASNDTGLSEMLSLAKSYLK